MRPFIFAGHNRPLSKVVYNKDGDIIVTACKAGEIYVIRSGDAQMVGSYMEHQGAVNDVAIDCSSRYVVSGASDYSAHIWNLRTGETVHKIVFNSPVVSVDVSRDAPLILIVSGGKMGFPSSVTIMNFDVNALDRGEKFDESPVVVLMPSDDEGNATIARFGPRRLVYMGHESGALSLWELESPRALCVSRLFKNYVTDLGFSADRAFVIAASKDFTARLLSLQLEPLREFITQRPVNAAAICPYRKHVILGGGQEADLVTTTKQSSGMFESRFFHYVLNQEFGRIKGHFGPINTIAVSPYNESFVTGGEDGCVRIHPFGQDYLEFKIIKDEELEN